MRLTRKAYEEWLNELGVPQEDMRSEGGRIPDYAQYGVWTRKNDPIAFNVGYNEWVREAEYRSGKNPRRRGKLMRRRVARNGFAGSDFAKAKKQAQANADHFAEPYVVFRDSSGRLRVERTSIAGTTAMRDGTVVHPNTAKYRRDYYGGELYGHGHRVNPRHYIYTQCPVCKHPNVHVDANGLIKTHYDGSKPCPGSGRRATEQRSKPIKRNPRAKYKYKTARYLGYLIRTYEPGEVAVYGSGRVNAREKLITVASVARAKTWISKRKRRIGRN